MIEPSIDLKDGGISDPLKTNKPPQQSGGQAFWFSIGTAVALAAAAFLFLINLLTQSLSGVFSWQMLVLGLVFLAGSIVALVAGQVKTNLSLTVKAILILSSVEIALLAVAAFVPGMGILAALIGLLYSTIVTFTLLPQSQGEITFIATLTYAMVISLVSIYPPFEQISVPVLQIYMPALLGILLMVFIALLLMELIAATLRIKLITIALAIVMVPLALLAIIVAGTSQIALQNQLNQGLKLAASDTAEKVDNFFQTNVDAVTKDASNIEFSAYLAIPPDQRKGSPEEAAMRKVIITLQNTRGTRFLNSYGVLDSNGVNVFDTVPANIGMNEKNNDYFNLPRSNGRVYASTVVFDPNVDPVIVFSGPVRDQNQNIVGYIRTKYDAGALQQLLKDNTSALGLRSYPALYDENLIRLADAVTPEYLYKSVKPFSQTQRAAIVAQKRAPNLSMALISTNLPDLANYLANYLKRPYFTTAVEPDGPTVQPVSAAVVSLQSRPWIVAYYEDTALLNKTLDDQQKTMILIATLLTGAVSFLATFATRLISNPIILLTNTAEKISVGNFDLQAQVQSNDEIGLLANAFNVMTRQLRAFINELEERVQSRTKQLAEQNDILQYRSRQLQTISDVAGSVASTQALEEFLDRVTSLISERFDFYHVGIFLIDESGENAELRASNSEGGKRMLARGHRLAVGQVGIVGFVTGNGQPRIATDVGQDAVFFNNPDLPDTRSEMALPLISGEKVIGALDVQSTQSNVFTNEDVELFTILAGQVAIAIVNNRLYEETTRALVEMQNLHRQYIQQEWGRDTGAREHNGYLYTHRGVIRQQLARISPDIQDVFDTGQTVVRSENDTQEHSSMAVPIILRGETIGVIQFQEIGADREWSEDELATAQAVADQVAIALENARLFEQTVRRAERERKVLEITSKIRSTNDPQQMLRVALEELQGALKASRAQIVLQPQAGEEFPKIGGNGNGAH
jgi:GAF domain-containing protein/HAMP domain-containing protein